MWIKTTVTGPNVEHAAFPFSMAAEQTPHFWRLWWIRPPWPRHASGWRTSAHCCLTKEKTLHDVARRSAARGHTRETIYDAVTPAEGVIYSLICCGNGQRIITCKILINVLQQQTSFAKLVSCCSAPDSEQLNWHEENKVLRGRTWTTPAAEPTSGSGPRGKEI